MLLALNRAFVECSDYPLRNVCLPFLNFCFIYLPYSLVKDMDDVCCEKKDSKSCPRDSGYDSLSNKLSILDKLLHTHPVWLQLGLNDNEAVEILQSQLPGVRDRSSKYVNSL